MTENKDAKNKNHMDRDNTTNELSEEELTSVSGGGLVSDVVQTVKDVAVDVAKTGKDLVTDVVHTVI